MSEPDSLYLRITLSRSAYEAFRLSPLARVTDYDDWLPWLATRSFSGGPITPETLRDWADASRSIPETCRTTGECIDALASGFGARSVYEEGAGVWRLMVGQFSENYQEYVEWLAVLRAVARFKDRPGADPILIFSYFWRNPGGTLVSVEAGTSRLVAQPDAATLDEANAALRAFQNELTGGRQIDDL